MTTSQTHPQASTWADALPTLVSLALGIVFIGVVAGVFAEVLARIPVPPGVIYSSLAWTLLAATMTVLVFIAWLTVSRIGPHALHNAALVCAPIAAALIGVSARTNALALPLVFASLIGIALVGRHLGRYRTAVLLLCSVGAFVVAAWALLGLGVSALDSGSGAVTRSPAAVSADGRLSAVATIVREGAWGSDFEYVVIVANGSHLLEQVVYVDDASFGVAAVWTGPRTLRVGNMVIRVIL